LFVQRSEFLVVYATKAPGLRGPADH